MLSPSPESAFAVRILTDGKSPRRPAGAGFLVTPQHVVTCAHVVNEVLGRKQTAAERPPPLPVLLDFPLLHGQQAAQAKLLRWFPVKADSAFGELEDIAILELLPDTPLPAAAQPAPLVLLDGDGRQLSGQEVRMYGFAVPDGTYANGVLQGMTAKGWAEIHHADSGSVDRGFSGAAVWSVRENAVCGMIVSMLSSAASYMIPAASLFKACPEIDVFSRSLNPYKGLEAFREKDARFYFGREADAAKLKEKIEKQPFTAVLGASGSGKSSLVFAGLLPLLRQDSWLFAACRPRNHAFEELAACLVPLLYEDELERVKKSRLCAADLLAGELLLSDLLRRIADRNERRRFLLIVDQFEELFTLNADSGLRQRFIASLLDAAGAAVLLTMRADFLETALGDPCFAKKLNDCPPLLLAPMGGAELKQAAERPAELLGIRFEPGLADLLVAELDSEPGSLPLLEFCLTQLWEQQTFRQISHAACNAIGGVRGALAGHADKVLAEFDHEAVRRIFLRLVRPGRGTEDTRQVAALAEFPEEQRGLIRQLASRRLLVTSGDEGGQRVEVAHEALIRHWRTLKGWVDEDREFLVWRDKLRILLRQWQESDHDEGALLRGLPLDEALQWRGSYAEHLSGEMIDFIKDSEQLRERERQEREATQRERERLLLEANYNLAKAFEEKALAAMKTADEEGTQAYKQAVLFASVALEQKVGHRYSALELSSASSLFAPEVFNAALIGLDDLKGHNEEVNSVTFSPDGKRLASASSDKTVRIWDVKSGKELMAFEGHGSSVESVAFSPDGKRLASASLDNTVRLWDAESSNVLMVFKGTESHIEDVSFSPDGKRLASASWDKTVRLWDVESGKELMILKGHENDVKSITFSPDGKRIASASSDKTVRLWDAENGKELMVFKGHEKRVNSVAFSPDGKRLASVSSDNTVRIWDTEKGKELLILKGHEESVNSVAFSPDGRRIATASGEFFADKDYTVRLWDAENGKELIVFKGHEKRVNSVAFSPDGKLLASASADKTVQLWDTESGKEELMVLNGHEESVNSVAFSPDGKRIASASLDNTVRLWDTESGKELMALNGHGVYSVAFSPDGKRLASASSDNTVRIWDVESGNELMILNGYGDYVRDVSFSPDGKRLAFASGRAVQLWDVENGKELMVLKGYGDYVKDVSFSPDGRRLAFASGHTVQLWDVERSKELSVLKVQVPKHFADSVAFSPDGKWLASAFNSVFDKTVRLWDVERGIELRILKGHENDVNSVTFSPDGRKIVSASDDKTVRIWDVRTYTLFLHDSKPTPLYRTFIKAVKFLWQLDVQGLEIVHKERTPADMERFGSLLAPPPLGQSKFDQVLEWAEKQQEN